VTAKLEHIFDREREWAGLVEQTHPDRPIPAKVRCFLTEIVESIQG